MSVNKAIIIGNLGQDPELRHTGDGTPVATLSVATNETWKDKQGTRQERTEWHRVVCWQGLAETCGRYLSKGRQVYVEGRIQTRDWQDKDGNERQTKEIVAREVKFLGGRDGSGAEPGF
jgi:single-strand DNA-binding protein